MSQLSSTPPPEAAPRDGRRRHIGYIISLFPSYDETFILREMKGLADRGVELRIFSLRQRTDPLIQDDARPFVSATCYAAYLLSWEVLRAVARALKNKPGALVEVLGLIVRGCWRRPLALLKSLVLLPKTLFFAERAEAEGIERLHAHWATYPATSALVISRLTKIPWSLTCHAHDIFQDPTLLAEKIGEADFALTCTADNKRYLESVTSKARDKVIVSYHGLDLRLFSPAPPRPPSPRVELLSVGNFDKRKGFPILVEACGILKKRGVLFNLTLVGGGAEESAVRQTLARAGVADEVRLPGYLTQRELIPVYQAADIFVLPAILEFHYGLPNVLIEALACGVPVVATPLPAVPELVEDGVTGLLAADRDPHDLATKIETLARDPALRESMARAGRRRVETLFDIDRTIETVLAAVLSSHDRPASSPPDQHGGS